jgi:anthranilate phosphoribosyltransferase
LRRIAVEQIAGGAPDENAHRLAALLAGRGSEADAAVVALNAGALLLTAGRAASLREGTDQALDALGSGRSNATLQAFVEASRG